MKPLSRIVKTRCTLYRIVLMSTLVSLNTSHSFGEQSQYSFGNLGSSPSISTTAETTSSIEMEEVLGRQVASSAEARGEQKLEALIHHGFNYQEVSNQLTLGYFISSDNILALNIGQEASRDYGKHQFSAAAQLKHFWTNSFYSTQEVYYLNYFQNKENPGIQDDELKALGLAVRVGNQWQWNNFTIGCDWVGIGKNVITFADQMAGKSSTQKLSLIALNAYVGYSF